MTKEELIDLFEGNHVVKVKEDFKISGCIIHKGCHGIINNKRIRFNVSMVTLPKSFEGKVEWDSGDINPYHDNLERLH